MCRRTLVASSAAGSAPVCFPCTSPLVIDHRPAIQVGLADDLDGLLHSGVDAKVPTGARKKTAGRRPTGRLERRSSRAAD